MAAELSIPSPGCPARTHEAAVVDYYTHTTDEYRPWSPGLHMHFGYWRWPLPPWTRPPMLAALSETVHARLGLPEHAEGTVLDLGCGVGAASRQLAQSQTKLQVLGLTLTPAQVELGTALAAEAQLEQRVQLLTADYRAIPRADATSAGAYAIESACHDPEGGAGLIREAARVLADGARLVVADGFRRRPLPWAARICERRMGAGWILPELTTKDRFIALLRGEGFEVEQVEDISLRVLPSLLHVPFVSLRYRLQIGSNATAHQRGHLRASLYCLLCAVLWPRRFGYFIITARRTRLDAQPLP